MSDPTSIKTLSDSEKILARALGYRLISCLFRHPTEHREWLSDISQLNWLEMADCWDFEPVFTLKEKIVKLFQEIERIDLPQWMHQYENIFGHTACSKVPLYELEYGEEHSHRQPQELADITGFYEAFGLRGNAGIHERPDHISVEAEFIYSLLYKMALALREKDSEHAQICQKAYERFIQEHLGAWLPALTYRISKYSDSVLLRLIADFAYSFLEQECGKHNLVIGTESLSIRPIEEKTDTGCVSCEFGPKINTESES